MANLALIKFGERQHLEQLLDRGELYFNTIEYFQKLEADEFRGDRDEGLSMVYDYTQVDLTMRDQQGKEIVRLNAGTGLRGQVRFQYTQHAQLNVYCMYVVTEQSVWVDPRNFTAGDSFLIVGSIGEFLRRVKAAFQLLKDSGTFENFNTDVVRYVDKTVHTGHMAPFLKYDHFDYQSEFRMVLSPGLAKPFILEIGPLHDIAAIMELSKINELLSIGHNLLPPKPKP